MTADKDQGQDRQSVKPEVDKIEIKRGIVPDEAPGPPPDSISDQRGRPVYLTRIKRRIPPWLIAVIVFATLLAGLFLVVPLLVENSLDPDPDPSLETPVPQETGDLIQRQDLAVVKVSSAPLLAEPDRKSIRIAEALFNEQVTLLDTRYREYVLVQLEDGVEGYIRRDQLSADKRSLSPENKVAKLLVREPSKRIMSHARQGSLLVEAPMGSIFYADYRNGDLLRVTLPDGESGWVNSSGVLLLPPLSSIPLEDNASQLLVATLLAFYDSPLVPGGATTEGISPAGALYVSGLLNGYSLSRDPYALLDLGLAIEAGDLEALAELEEGDVIFFHAPSDPDLIQSIAVLVSDGQLLLNLPNKSTLRLIDLASSETAGLAERIMAIRRFTPGA